MAPALMGCWIEGGAGFFVFSFLPGGAVELPGRSRPALGVVDLRRGDSVNLSLCLFARARGEAVMMVPAAGARYGVARDGNRFKQLR